LRLFELIGRYEVALENNGLDKVRVDIKATPVH
jgi:hypothetical protein